MIPLTECIHGGFYKIHARNFNYGVFNKNKNGFVGVREKFGNEYLFVEFHYDTGPPYGTVKPHEFLEMCPIENLKEYEFYEEDGKKYFRDNPKLREWLDNKLLEYEK